MGTVLFVTYTSRSTFCSSAMPVIFFLDRLMAYIVPSSLFLHFNTVPNSPAPSSPTCSNSWWNLEMFAPLRCDAFEPPLCRLLYGDANMEPAPVPGGAGIPPLPPSESCIGEAARFVRAIDGVNGLSFAGRAVGCRLAGAVPGRPSAVMPEWSPCSFLRLSCADKPVWLTFCSKDRGVQGASPSFK